MCPYEVEKYLVIEGRRVPEAHNKFSMFIKKVGRSCNQAMQTNSEWLVGKQDGL